MEETCFLRLIISGLERLSAEMDKNKFFDIPTSQTLLPWSDLRVGNGNREVNEAWHFAALLNLNAVVSQAATLMANLRTRHIKF